MGANNKQTVATKTGSGTVWVQGICHTLRCRQKCESEMWHAAAGIRCGGCQFNVRNGIICGSSTQTVYIWHTYRSAVVIVVSSGSGVCKSAALIAQLSCDIFITNHCVATHPARVFVTASFPRLNNFDNNINACSLPLGAQAYLPPTPQLPH